MRYRVAQRSAAAQPGLTQVLALMNFVPEQPRTSVMKLLARQLFHELAMHHHNYVLTNRSRNEDLPGQDPEYLAHYFRLVTSHNYAMLALTLCKVMEFHTSFRRDLTEVHRAELDKINSRIARSKILEFRNRYVGHLFDKKTKMPLEPNAITAYWDALLDGQTEQQFRIWWWSTIREPELTSIAGLLVRIADHDYER
jgi:hypothetical protein